MRVARCVCIRYLYYFKLAIAFDFFSKYFRKRIMSRAGWSEEPSYFCELRLNTVSVMTYVLVNWYGDKTSLKSSTLLTKLATSLHKTMGYLFGCR